MEWEGEWHKKSSDCSCTICSRWGRMPPNAHKHTRFAPMRLHPHEEQWPMRTKTHIKRALAWENSWWIASGMLSRITYTPRHLLQARTSKNQSCEQLSGLLHSPPAQRASTTQASTSLRRMALEKDRRDIPDAFKRWIHARFNEAPTENCVPLSIRSYLAKSCCLNSLCQANRGKKETQRLVKRLLLKRPLLNGRVSQVSECSCKSFGVPSKCDREIDCIREETMAPSSSAALLHLWRVLFGEFRLLAATSPQDLMHPHENHSVHAFPLSMHRLSASNWQVKGRNSSCSWWDWNVMCWSRNSVVVASIFWH